jgi:hypothetical protein
MIQPGSSRMNGGSPSETQVVLCSTHAGSPVNPRHPHRFSVVNVVSRPSDAGSHVNAITATQIQGRQRRQLVQSTRAAPSTRCTSCRAGSKTKKKVEERDTGSKMNSTRRWPCQVGKRRQGNFEASSKRRMRDTRRKEDESGCVFVAGVTCTLGSRVWGCFTLCRTRLSKGKVEKKARDEEETRT